MGQPTLFESKIVQATLRSIVCAHACFVTKSINFRALYTGVSYPDLACFGRFRFHLICAKFVCRDSIQQTLHIAWLHYCTFLKELRQHDHSWQNLSASRGEYSHESAAVQDRARQCAPFIVNHSSGGFNFCLESHTLRELSSAKWRWNTSSAGTQFNSHLVEQGWLALRYSKRVPSRAAMEFPPWSMARPRKCTKRGHMHASPSNIPACSWAMQTESRKHKLLTWPEQARPAYWHQTCMNHESTYKQTSAALQLAKANCSNSSCEESPSSSIASTFQSALSDVDVDCGRLGYFWKEAKCQYDKPVSALVGSTYGSQTKR